MWVLKPWSFNPCQCQNEQMNVIVPGFWRSQVDRRIKRTAVFWARAARGKLLLANLRPSLAIFAKHRWVCLKIVYPYTQWFCWSLSLLNGYFIGNIPYFQTNTDFVQLRFGSKLATTKHNMAITYTKSYQITNDFDGFSSPARNRRFRLFQVGAESEKATWKILPQNHLGMP